MTKIFQLLYIVAVILLTNTAVVDAQSEPSKRIDARGETFLTMNLLSLAPPLPRWRFGYIQTINPRWKVGLDVGYGSKGLVFRNTFNSRIDSYKLWEIRPELYYVIYPNRKTINYISLEFFYIDHKEHGSDGRYCNTNLL